MTNESIKKPLLGGELLWALAGGILLLNSFLSKFFFQDEGVNSAISAVIALVFLLPPLLKIVYEDFKHNRVHMNELVLIAVAAGASRGDMLTAGMIAFFMLIGLIMETKSASGAKKSLESITRMTRVKARKIKEDGTEQELETEELTPGDKLRVRPGEIIPADGEIISGSSSIQEANITGESIPVDKTAGNIIFAGTVNLSSVIDVRVSKTGTDTTLGKVKELILAAEKSRPRFIRMIDQYAKYYTPLVLIFSFFVWAINGHNMDCIVAILVAACPIALVLSTPSAAIAALSAAARLGVLIKNISDIEALSTVTAFIFDKTGTLTTGDLEVAELAPANGVESSELLTIAASAEQHSNHPVALAVCRLAKKVNLKLKTVSDISEKPGRGVKSKVENSETIIGNSAWIEENKINLAGFPDFQTEKNSGMSMLFVVRNKKPLGWIALEDKVRPDAEKCVSDLKNFGIQELAIVTGDRNGVAAKFAKQLNIKNFYGECAPSDKIEKVNSFKEEGYNTVFVGDGVNDAPALAASNIGIAMGAAGSDLAVETATIALMNNELNRLPFLLKLAKVYRNVMAQNFILGALFIFCGMAAGASGYLTAVPAAFLQVASAVVIVMNSARLVKANETMIH